MKIAYLCCDFGVPILGMGGSSVHLQEITQALRCLGHEVKIFSPSPDVDGENAGLEGFHPVPLGGFADEVVRLLASEDMAQPQHLVREWRALFYCEYLQKVLFPTLAAFQPNVIYERYSLFAYAGVELAQRLQVPFLLEVNAPLHLEQAKYRQLVLMRTAEKLEQRILNSADALLVVSTALADYSRRLGVPSERITVLPNGVNPEQFHPTVSGERVRSLYKLDGRWVIGFVGSLRPWHDLNTPLAAVKLLANADERFHLFIVGEGPQMEQLRKLGAGYITCTSAVAHQQIPQFMAAMDVVVVPYAEDVGLYFSPIKLFEAMAMAKPIIGARIGQVAEALIHGETGLLYKPGDAEDLADKIRELLAMPDCGTGLGAAARQWVVDSRTWEKNAGQIVSVAQALLEMPKAS
jgi:glycosyltransferase involved in cell wall biosynthesis